MAEAILRCPRCGLHKEASLFTKPRPGKYCKVCHSEYVKAHYRANREKYLAMSKEWRLANPERKKANDAAWYRANKDRALESSRQWVARNQEKRKASYTKYRREKLALRNNLWNRWP